MPSEKKKNLVLFGKIERRENKEDLGTTCLDLYNVRPENEDSVFKIKQMSFCSYVLCCSGQDTLSVKPP